MRTISISTDTFAAIWRHRRSGEDTEEAILRRVLGVEDASGAEAPSAPAGRDGFEDDRNDVRFPEGFEIFRTYKGRQYRAKATNGKWLLLNNNVQYPSLHKLSSAVVEGNENSWNNWKYSRSDGTETCINSLRDETKVPRRV